MYIQCIHLYIYIYIYIYVHIKIISAPEEVEGGCGHEAGQGRPVLAARLRELQNGRGE